MTKMRFIELCVDGGLTTYQAELLWSQRPLDFESVASLICEDSVRDAARELALFGYVSTGQVTVH